MEFKIEKEFLSLCMWLVIMEVHIENADIIPLGLGYYWMI